MTVAGDVKITIADYAFAETKNIWLNHITQSEILAISYYWCTALGRMDFEMEKKLEERESIKSAQSYVLHATYAVLDHIEWYDRADMPKFHRRKERQKAANDPGRKAREKERYKAWVRKKKAEADGNAEDLEAVARKERRRKNQKEYMARLMKKTGAKTHAEAKAIVRKVAGRSSVVEPAE